MPKQKLTHEIEWEPVTGSYRILKITGSLRQPTLAEAQEYMYENHLPEEIWVAGFYRYKCNVNNGVKNTLAFFCRDTAANMSYQLSYKIHTLTLRIKSFSRILSRRYKKYLQSTFFIGTLPKTKF